MLTELVKIGEATHKGVERLKVVETQPAGAPLTPFTVIVMLPAASLGSAVYVPATASQSAISTPEPLGEVATPKLPEHAGVTVTTQPLVAILAPAGTCRAG